MIRSNQHSTFARTLALLFLLLPLIPAAAVDYSPVFFDDFERTELGQDWTAPAPSEAVINYSAVADTSVLVPLDNLANSNGSLVYLTDHELTGPFVIEADLGMATNQWNGIIFHLNENSETGEVTYYYFGVRPGTTTSKPAAQLLKRSWDDFTAETGAPVRAFSTPSLGDEYLARWPAVIRLRVESNEPGVFVVSVFDGETNLLGEGGFTIEDDASDRPVFTGGRVGILGRQSGRYDTFALKIADAVPTGFEAWQSAHFIPQELMEEGISGPQADVAGDNIPNLMKYALGASPWQPARSKLPIPQIANGFMVIGFSQAIALPDVESRVESSDDLVNWEATSAQLIETQDNGDGTESVLYQLGKPVTDAGQQFARLRVRFPPTNVALNKPVEASSEYTAGDTTYFGAHAVDGITTNASRWITDGESPSASVTPQWLIIDLQESYVLNEAAIVNGHMDGSSFYIPDFRLEYWNGSDWALIPGAAVTNNDARQVRFLFNEAVTTDRVRFASDTAGFIRVIEIEVFGTRP